MGLPGKMFSQLQLPRHSEATAAKVSEAWQQLELAPELGIILVVQVCRM